MADPVRVAASLLLVSLVVLFTIFGLTVANKVKTEIGLWVITSMLGVFFGCYYIIRVTDSDREGFKETYLVPLLVTATVFTTAVSLIYWYKYYVTGSGTKKEMESYFITAVVNISLLILFFFALVRSSPDFSRRSGFFLLVFLVLGFHATASFLAYETRSSDHRPYMLGLALASTILFVFLFLVLPFLQQKVFKSFRYINRKTDDDLRLLADISNLGEGDRVALLSQNEPNSPEMIALVREIRGRIRGMNLKGIQEEAVYASNALRRGQDIDINPDMLRLGGFTPDEWKSADNRAKIIMANSLVGKINQKFGGARYALKDDRDGDWSDNTIKQNVLDGNMLADADVGGKTNAQLKQLLLGFDPTSASLDLNQTSDAIELSTKLSESIQSIYRPHQDYARSGFERLAIDNKEQAIREVKAAQVGSFGNLYANVVNDEIDGTNATLRPGGDGVDTKEGETEIRRTYIEGAKRTALEFVNAELNGAGALFEVGGTGPGRADSTDAAVRALEGVDVSDAANDAQVTYTGGRGATQQPIANNPAVGSLNFNKSDDVMSEEEKQSLINLLRTGFTGEEDPMKKYLDTRAGYFSALSDSQAAATAVGDVVREYTIRRGEIKTAQGGLLGRIRRGKVTRQGNADPPARKELEQVAGYSVRTDSTLQGY